MAIHIKNQQKSKNLNLRRVRKTLAKALSLLGRQEAELSLLFVGSRKMKLLNTRYRGISKETDVLSFPMTEDLYIDNAPSRLSFPLVRARADSPGRTGNHSPKGLRTSRSDKTGRLPSPCTSSPAWPLILGDIVISIPKTIEQAGAYSASFYEELFRLLIHGLLHLLGYDHEKSRYQKMRMEKKEKEILHAVAQLD